MANILDISFRNSAIGEIGGEENKQRKEESLRRFEIYRQRQRQFILDRLEEEFSVQTVREMRTITSINLAKKIVDEMASIYKTQPEREYENATEAQAEYLDNLYEYSQANVKLKRANRYYKLQDQCAIQVLPKDGIIDLRVLMPHHYDVIPDPNDPEKAKVYILNILDKSEMLQETQSNQDLSKAPTGGKEVRQRDERNQMIGDNEDFKDKTQKFVWWSKDYNFMTNEQGTILDMETGEPMQGITESDPRIINPLGELPFVDVATEKDFEFWVRSSNGVVDGSVDMGVIISDLSNTVRLQNYSQAIITSESVPRDMHVGPHSIIHLPLDPNKPELTPRFEFASPSPDISGSLEVLQAFLAMLLKTLGVDPSRVSANMDGQNFSSGIERLLAMIERFEASQDDMDLFRVIEQKVFKLFKKWNEVLINTQGMLMDELEPVRLSDDIKLNVQFASPTMLQTQKEKEESSINLMNAGLLSRIEALMDLRGVSEEMAREIAARIDEEDLAKLPDNFMEGESEDEPESNGPDEESEAEDQPE